jgi:uncharacterized protein (DUF4213/DUF364 family)
MQNLSDSLTNLNPKQKLLVLRGGPVEVLPLVWKEWGITHLVFEKVCPVLSLISVIQLILVWTDRTQQPTLDKETPKSSI